MSIKLYQAHCMYGYVADAGTCAYIQHRICKLHASHIIDTEPSTPWADAPQVPVAQGLKRPLAQVRDGFDGGILLVSE